MPFCAEVAELVDAADSKSAALKSVWVRVPSSAPLNPFFQRFQSLQNPIKSLFNLL